MPHYALKTKESLRKAPSIFRDMTIDNKISLPLPSDSVNITNIIDGQKPIVEPLKRTDFHIT